MQVAQLRLQSTRVAAPFDGHIGRPLVDAGNLVTAEKTLLATLASTDPMYVYFNIDERTVLTLRRKAAQEGAPTSLPVFCGMPGEDGFPHETKVDSAEGHVDPATGTVSVRAVLPNKDGLLLPGMAVNVRLATSAPYKALLVPEQFMEHDKRPTAFVYVVNGQNVIERRAVMIGRRQGDRLWAVSKGLTADDWVVAEDSSRDVRPGTTVTPEKTAIPTKP
jgi:RND family efflux transporter MFP subunit